MSENVTYVTSSLTGSDRSRDLSMYIENGPWQLSHRLIKLINNNKHPTFNIILNRNYFTASCVVQSHPTWRGQLTVRDFNKISPSLPHIMREVCTMAEINCDLLLFSCKPKEAWNLGRAATCCYDLHLKLPRYVGAFVAPQQTDLTNSILKLPNTMLFTRDINADPVSSTSTPTQLTPDVLQVCSQIKQLAMLRVISENGIRVRFVE